MCDAIILTAGAIDAHRRRRGPCGKVERSPTFPTYFRQSFSRGGFPAFVVVLGLEKAHWTRQSGSVSVETEWTRGT